MKVLPLTLGPIVGATTSTSVRLWGRADYEPTPEGPTDEVSAPRSFVALPPVKVHRF